MENEPSGVFDRRGREIRAYNILYHPCRWQGIIVSVVRSFTPSGFVRVYSYSPNGRHSKGLCKLPGESIVSESWILGGDEYLEFTKWIRGQENEASSEDPSKVGVQPHA